MLTTLTDLLGMHDSPTWSRVHRWSLAHPAGTRDRTHHVGDDRIGLCGDSWSRKPRVEAAWLSGTELGYSLVTRFGSSELSTPARD